MNFSEKLKMLRKSCGITQEELAENLYVSRQAVAKWEAGQAFSDISNLIEISELFHTTVDYLVKEDSCVKKPDLLCINQVEIADFLVAAKKKTYAGKGAESQSIRPFSHDYEFSEGEYTYIDTYYGGEWFCGEETVWHKGKPIFSMNYCGRVLDKGFSGDFLKAVLLAVPLDKPFRGPKFYQERDSMYSCKVNGDIEWFQGFEEISLENVRVYEGFFHGSTLR